MSITVERRIVITDHDENPDFAVKLSHLRDLVMLAERAGFSDTAELGYDFDEGGLRAWISEPLPAKTSTVVDEPPAPAAVVTASYPCTACTRGFTTAQGLAVHTGRSHHVHVNIAPADYANVAAELDDANPPDVEPEPTVFDQLRAAAHANPPATHPTSRLGHPAYAICECGHAQRRHEDSTGGCDLCEECGTFTSSVGAATA